MFWVVVTWLQSRSSEEHDSISLSSIDPKNPTVEAPKKRACAKTPGALSQWSLPVISTRSAIGHNTITTVMNRLGGPNDGYGIYTSLM